MGRSVGSKGDFYRSALYGAWLVAYRMRSAAGDHVGKLSRGAVVYPCGIGGRQACRGLDAFA